jgi:DNA invertase Pin-like site-specific DNA recombinase
MRAIVYTRVSTDEQNQSGLGLDDQVHKCREWAKKHRAELVGPFTDDEGISGALSLDKRPALLEAIANLKRGDVLLVAKRDRLGRGDPFLLGMIEASAKRKGARVVSAAGEGTDGDSPADVLMRRIIDAFGEYERLIIKARTSAALQAKIRRGQRVGTLRFGYDLGPDGKTLIANANEQAVLLLIREFQEAGCGPFEIAGELNRRGLTSKRGGQWSHQAVARILSRRHEPQHSCGIGAF